MSFSDDDDPEAAAMAAAMGFSSFGSAPQKKKRKFNSATDAFVAGQDLEALDRGGKKGKGSGGNTVALGKRRVPGGAPSINASTTSAGPLGVGVGVGNSEEIELEEGSGSEEERPNYVDTSMPAPVHEDGEEDGPNYVDTSLPPPAAPEEALEMQGKIDAILASIQPPPGDGTTQIHGLPARPPGSSYSDSGSSRWRGGGGGGFAGGRQRNERWWEGYYDPSFNTNPWEKSEREVGLGSVGSWLEQGHWDFKTGMKTASAAGS